MEKPNLFSTEAEQSVIGAILMDSTTIDKIIDNLTAEDFYHEQHCNIFKAIMELHVQNHPIDLVTVAECLEKNELLTLSGGMIYIAGIVNNTPSSANVLRYAEIVRERKILRELVNAGQAITQMVNDNWFKCNVKDLLSQAEARLFEVSKIVLKKTKPTTFKNAVDNTIEYILNKERGLSSGFDKLDSMTNGFQNGDLIILAGRPSSGKTALALGFAQQAIFQKKNVLMFSMEMSARQIITRMLGSVGKVNQQRILAGTLSNAEMEKMDDARKKLSVASMVIEETAALTIAELKSRARRIIRRQKNGISLIVIDYLQLMSGMGKGENRNNDLTIISAGLKALAKECNVPVIALSQLSRNVERRENKRPFMSDLRDSGSIEQDADLVMMVYREAMYSETANKELSELIVVKHRNGEVGTISMRFVGEYIRFESTSMLDKMREDEVLTMLKDFHHEDID